MLARRLVISATGVADDEELHLIGPDEIAYRLDLTPAQLKITWVALKSLSDDPSIGTNPQTIGFSLSQATTSPAFRSGGNTG